MVHAGFRQKQTLKGKGHCIKRIIAEDTNVLSTWSIATK